MGDSFRLIRYNRIPAKVTPIPLRPINVPEFLINRRNESVWPS